MADSMDISMDHLNIEEEEPTTPERAKDILNDLFIAMHAFVLALRTVGETWPVLSLPINGILAALHFFLSHLVEHMKRRYGEDAFDDAWIMDPKTNTYVPRAMPDEVFIPNSYDFEHGIQLGNPFYSASSCWDLRLPRYRMKGNDMEMCYPEKCRTYDYPPERDSAFHY